MSLNASDNAIFELVVADNAKLQRAESVEIGDGTHAEADEEREPARYLLEATLKGLLQRNKDGLYEAIRQVGDREARQRLNSLAEVLEGEVLNCEEDEDDED